jgi:hypothetical protein
MMAKLTIKIEDKEEKTDVTFDWDKDSFPMVDDVRNKTMTDAQIIGVSLMHLCKIDRLDKLYELVNVKKEDG